MVRWRSHQSDGAPRQIDRAPCRLDGAVVKLRGADCSYSAARAEPRNRPTSEPKVLDPPSLVHDCYLYRLQQQKGRAPLRRGEGGRAGLRHPRGSHGARGFETLPSPPTVFHSTRPTAYRASHDLLSIARRAEQIPEERWLSGRRRPRSGAVHRQLCRRFESFPSPPSLGHLPEKAYYSVSQHWKGGKS